MEPTGSQLFQHLLLVSQFLLEDGDVVPDALRRMTVARSDALLAERLRYLERELILARGRPAVRHLDLVDQLEHRHALGRLVRRHLEGWPPVPPEVDRVKEVPERVCHDHEPTYLVQHMPQLHRPPDPRHVAVQPDHDHVSHVRRDFHPAEGGAAMKNIVHRLLQ